MKLKQLFIFIYLIVSFYHFSVFEGSLSVLLSFSVNLVILSFIAYYHLFLEKVYSPFISTYIVFNYLFFIVAPMSQINTMVNESSLEFVHFFPYRPELFIKANIFISLFHVVFFLCYDGFKKTIYKRIIRKRNDEVKNPNYPFHLIIFSIISIWILISNVDFILYELDRPAWLKSDFSKSTTLIVTKVLFIMPLGALIIYKKYMQSSNKYASNLIIAVACMLIISSVLVILKNPLITKRNDLGPLIFVLIFMFLPKLLNSNVKILSFLFFALLVGFPLMQILTHLDYGFTEILSNPSLLSNQIDKGALSKGYFSLNYDAFINIGVVFEHVEKNGLSYGFQMLSAFLFFVPRSLWPEKPDASGMIVGDYLVENHGYTFTNLANPFIAEGYLNFGIVGIILFAAALSLIVVFFLLWLNSNDWFKKAVAFYFALHLMMVLRGDFTNSYAFFVGSVLGFYLLPKFLMSVSDLLISKKIAFVEQKTIYDKD